MFSRDTCFRIGFISKLHGYKGELIFQFETESPEEFSELESVFVEYDTKLIPFFLTDIHLKHKGSAIVKLEDIDSEKKAQLLVGCNLYLPLDNESEIESDDRIPELIGYTLIDSKEGVVGKIVRVVNLNGNHLFEVESGELEILIPKQNSFINKIDAKSKSIFMTLPQGLLNLNSEEE